LSHDPAAVAAMLDARSVAVVGASGRPGSFGERMVTEVLRSEGDRRVHPVNPAYDSVAGLPCVPALGDLDEAPDLVLLGVGDKRLPGQLAAAAAVGARSAVVFGSALAPGVRDRLRSIAVDAGMALCGAGCMGFWNVRTGLRALGYVERPSAPVGPISVITHSGSVFSTLLRTRRRLGFDLVVSSGQELVTTTADYVDHVVEATATRLLTLVVETVREGGRLRASLRHARDAGLEVVVLPVGGSPLGAGMVAAHSGAVAGDDATWEALCDDTGSIRVHDLDELANTLELLAAPRRSGRGRGAGLATVHDSGAERTLLADLAHAHDVPLAELAEDTRARLRAELDEGLAADNPLDVWGEGKDTRELFGACLTAMAADPGVGITVLAVDLVEEYDGDTSYPDAVLDAAASTDEPLAVLAGLPSAVDEVAAARLRTAGIPVLEGARTGLLALRHLLRPPVPPDPLPPAPGPSGSGRPDVDDLLGRYGIGRPAFRRVASAQEARTAAVELGAPVVLKTAAPEVRHKTEAGGVVPGLRLDDVEAAYDDLAARLGPAATVHATAAEGVDLSMGIVRDPQLGPMVVLAAGGILVELLADRAVTLPPLSRVRARAMLDRLRLRPLLDGWRGAPSADVEAAVDVLVALGEIALAHGDRIDALELNPIRVGPDGALALDVLLLTRPEDARCTD
jgi:acyl-CoA synthetase (NDP forming)